MKKPAKLSEEELEKMHYTDQSQYHRNWSIYYSEISMRWIKAGIVLTIIWVLFNVGRGVCSL